MYFPDKHGATFHQNLLLLIMCESQILKPKMFRLVHYRRIIVVALATDIRRENQWRC
ncbi:hypothetical protein GHT06_022644 [Daphnia sinensis]|uniref:Uncharacterized protein n=1 Tax=Daphnia sinensis TaxID=1820382 RepID=A0AAD5KHV5_9CRUS|nr:hypothetical protein GHT06_022642 [Daphnia sinensis]KAI9552280.1 hypothetical protein GHT06_022641 [Daphnia sinensis]KAI9552282.1 hypothetical protein GHT06_022644 [Daphnia sinensis]